MHLLINRIEIRTRGDNNFINASQLCKAYDVQLCDWMGLDSTKKLIDDFSNDFIGCSCIDEEETHNGQTEFWIHPDLTIILAFWIRPALAVLITKWVREIFLRNERLKIHKNLSKFLIDENRVMMIDGMTELEKIVTSVAIKK
jgi:hypothetical protein